MNKSWTSSATFIFLAEVSTVVGILNATSSAWLGPDNITTGFAISSSMTSTKVLLVPSSIPFAMQITGIVSSINPLRLLEALLITWDGTANTT